MLNRTIIAQATPVGPGAIALIRISGIDAIKIATEAAFLPGQKILSEQKSHTISYGWIVDENGTKIDQVLFLLMRGPHTFTGEDVVEITCHNNQLLIASIINRYIQLGSYHAERGEFTRQAVENNKLSLVQAEAIQELISAQTTYGVKKSLAQLEGSLSSWITELEKKIITAQALCEASFEFLEEEYNPKQELIDLFASIIDTIRKAEELFSTQKQLKEGLRIALIGKPNAGKSSLLNALCQQERAIVTSIPGTTRDTIEITIWRNGIAWTIIDTAGLRETNDDIEKAGIARTYHEAEKSDLIILVIDGIEHSHDAEQMYHDIEKKHQEKCIRVATKSDLLPNKKEMWNTDISLSNKTRTGLEELENLIQKRINNLIPKSELPFTLNQRHMHTLTRIKTFIKDATKSLEQTSYNYELISLILHDALASCANLSGKEQSEALLDTVFNQFCVGK